MSTSNSVTMPSLFVGHGSPMNAIANNHYTQTLNQLGKSLPVPKAILCISAHWLTDGIYITSASNPKTIHDFYGFPEELYQVQYPAPGSPETAIYLAQMLPELHVKLDNGEWGLDHGSWSVIKHMYPKADVPVLQLSLDRNLDAAEHFKVAQSLKKLRNYGVMILGSGNIVHNLRLISWDEKAPVVKWAQDFEDWFTSKLENRDYKSLCEDYLQHPEGKKSVPTPEHYWPALYAMGASDENENLDYIIKEIQNASISMTSFIFR